MGQTWDIFEEKVEIFRQESTEALVEGDEFRRRHGVEVFPLLFKDLRFLRGVICHPL